MENNDVKSKLRELPQSECLAYLKNFIAEILSLYLYIENPRDLPKDTSSFEQGLTSLMAVEVKYKLERDLQINLDSTVLFNYSTVDKLSKFLIENKMNFSSDFQLYNNDSQAKQKKYAKQVLQKYFGINE
ncbi:MAG: acyl carrier protein [Gammaproteobacteria bacterium]|nr:acyl carrier protein [Gammaproteobacteria bacterium]